MNFKCFWCGKETKIYVKIDLKKIKKKSSSEPKKFFFYYKGPKTAKIDQNLTF